MARQRLSLTSAVVIWLIIVSGIVVCLCA